MSALVPLSRIAGQPTAVAALARLVAGGGAIAPMLFHGPPGCGKRTAALAFAASLVCRTPRDGDACGRCAHCARIEGADAITSMRDGSTGADAPRSYPDAGLISIPKDKTRVLVIQARDVALSLAVQPFELPRRVYIIDPADTLTTAAVNALLKPLEEPPAYAVLILVASSPWALPITIHSRVTSIAFRPLDAATVARLLEAEGLTPSEAAARAARARGNLARARELDLDAERDDLATWTAILERLAGGTPPAALAAAAGERFGASPERADEGLALLLAVLRDLGAAPLGVPPLALDAGTAGRLAPLLPALAGTGFERPGLIERLRREISIFHRNPKLTVEGAVLALGGVLTARDLG